jgi:hypothetical protein
VPPKWTISRSGIVKQRICVRYVTFSPSTTNPVELQGVDDKRGPSSPYFFFDQRPTDQAGNHRRSCSPSALGNAPPSPKTSSDARSPPPIDNRTEHPRTNPVVPQDVDDDQDSKTDRKCQTSTATPAESGRGLGSAPVRTRPQLSAPTLTEVSAPSRASFVLTPLARFG